MSSYKKFHEQPARVSASAPCVSVDTIIAGT
jgi:hypothetical protein